ncbi:MAG TPA: ATP-binding protein [Planctomycetota bacterium]|nr:ATP-binding protein [Planctomycetota bacterium]
MSLPPAPTDSDRFRLARQISLVLGFCAVVGGSISLIGWAGDLPRLTDWFVSGVSMQPNTALALMTSGLALLGSALSWRRASAGLATATALIGIATLFEHARGIDLGIDRMLLFDRAWGGGLTLSPGRMGIPACVSFTLLGVGLFLLGRDLKARRLASTLGLIATLIALLSLIGFAYGADTLHTLPRLTAISLQTAILILMVGTGLMAAAAEQGIVAMLLRDDAGGVLMRRLLPPFVLVTLLLGWLRVRGQELEHYETAFGTAALVFAMIVMFTILLMMTSSKVGEAGAELQATARSQKLLAEIAELSTFETDTGQFLEASGKRVASALGVSRCGLATIDLDRGLIHSEHDYHGGLGSIGGVYPIDQYANHIQEDAKAGRTTAIEDLAADPRTSLLYEQRYKHIHIRSCVCVPLRREGRWVANFWIGHHEPRRWAAADLKWINNIADRVWMFVEKARAVDQQRSAQASLAENERLLRTVTEYAQVGLVIIGSDHRYLYANRAYAEVLGLSTHDIAGRHVSEVLGDAYAAQIRPRLDQAFSGEPVRYELSLPATADSTLERCFAVTYEPQIESGVVTSVVVAITDISQRKRDEQALRDADRHKDEFLATLAHELRNPLAPMSNSLELMKRAGDDRLLVEQARAMTERQLAQMVRLVDDLLDVSRITRNKITLKQETVELASILRDTVDSMRPQFVLSGLQLKVVLPSTPILLHADAVRLTQVFGNLLTNACKYTGRGGVVTLWAESDGGEAMISVDDTGIGIPREMLSPVFDMFVQVDKSIERSQGGLGIGLTLVRKLVEMHGGSVTARSEGLGHGSQFSVRLPCLVDAPSLTTPLTSDEQPLRIRARRILVVDDNQDTALSLAALLTLNGCDTQTARDGVEAVEKASSYRPEIVLLDIGLPKLSGYDACRAIRAQAGGRDIVMVALTGWGQDEDRLKSIEAGFDSHLVKPVDHDRLIRLLSDLLALRA